MHILFATILSLFLCVTASYGQSLSPRLQSVMASAGPAEKIAVIIELAEKADLRPVLQAGQSVRRMSAADRQTHRSRLIGSLQGRAEISQQSVQRFLRSRGVAGSKSLWINNSIAAEISPDVLEELAAMPEISAIRMDRVVTVPRVVPAATDGIEDNLHMVNAPALWGLGFEGQGQVVAILDTGVDHLHPDLSANWRGGSNSWFNPVAENTCDPTSPLFTPPCTPCDSSVNEPCDFPDAQTVVHGTGVTGLMVGGNAGGTSIGVAPQAQWIAAKIFKSDGTASASNIHLAFQWLLDPDGNPATDDAPDVVNSSWGLEPHGTCIEEFRPDIQALNLAGIATVFSAGNEGQLGSFTDLSPGNYPESLAVGSVGNLTSTVTVSDFSSRGPSSCSGEIYPEVVAPGFFVRSTDFTLGGTLPNSYLAYAGTSFAAPHLAGAMPLLMQAFPLATLADIEAAVQASAQDLGPLGPDNDYGYGLLDILGAYDWLLGVPSILIYDPVAPANDRNIDFGTIAAGVSEQKTVTIRNRGSVNLSLNSLVLSGQEYSLVTDNCSDRTLVAGQECSLTVQLLSQVDNTYLGTIGIISNDADEPNISLNLTGVVSAAAVPSPQLAIVDSVAPVNDGSISFGTVAIGSRSLEFFEIVNNGSGNLVLGALDASTLDAVFSVVTDACSGQTLAFEQSCLIEIDFTPSTNNSFSGVLSFTTNDPTSPHQLTVSGTGAALNIAPPTPQLISPAAGAVAVANPVEFVWRQAPDSDGGPVINRLFISEDPSFLGAVPIQVGTAATKQKVLLAQLGGLLLLPGLLLTVFGRRPVMKWLLTALVLCFLISCGGGGGGGGAAAVDPDLRSFQVSLSGQTTFFWKVSADDGQGGVVESTVSSFITE